MPQSSNLTGWTTSMARTTDAKTTGLKRVVITGATGMLGRALAELLVSRGIEVLLLANPHSTRLNSLVKNPLATIAPCTIDDYPRFEAPNARSWDAFYHLAWAGTFGDARNDMHAQAANIDYALDAVELAHRLGCKAFVGAGSQAEYGRVDGVLRSDTPTSPESGYGIAKLAAGQMTRLRCNQLGMRHVWVRILSVYGPYDGAQTMIMTTIDALLRGERPSLTPCEQQWDYLHQDDAARALMLAGEAGRHGAVYPLGSGQARPLREYVEAIRDAIDPALPLGIGCKPYASRQVMHLEADISALGADTGFAPHVPFSEGIRRIVETARKEG